MWLRKERGFTLVEMLLSLFFFIIIATLLLQLMLVIQREIASKKQLNPLEWEIFLNNIKREVKRGSSNEVKNNKIYISADNRVASIEQYGYILRRRVNNTGHEVMLFNVKHFSAKKENNLIFITVVDRSDKQYSAQLLFYNE